MHIHLHEPLVAQAVGQGVQADLAANLVHAHRAHVERLSHELGAGGEVAGQQSRRVELDEVVAVVGDQVAPAGERPAAGVRVDREGDEVDRRLLDRAVPHVRQFAEHVQRQPVDPGALLDGESPSLDKRRMLVVDRVGLLVEAVRHHDGLESLVGAAMSLVPLLFEPLDRIRLEGLISLDVRPALGAVTEKRRGVEFRRSGQRDRVAGQRRRDVSRHAVAREPAKVKNLILAVGRRRRLAVLAVLVLEPAVLQPDDLHAAGVQRDQLIDRAAPAGLDQRVAVAPEEHLAHHPLPPLERGHPVVRLVGEHLLQRVILGDLLAAAGDAAVDVERHGRDALREHADAGQDGRAVQARLRRDVDAAGGLPALDDFLEHPRQRGPHFVQVAGLCVLRFVGH